VLIACIPIFSVSDAAEAVDTSQSANTQTASAPLAQTTDVAATKTATPTKTVEETTNAKPSWLVQTLRDQTALAVFLTLALGYWIGSIKIGPFSLGSVTGTLLVGVIIGQMDIMVSPEVKSIFFTMFLFAIGYSVGPQFVRGVAHDGLPQAIFAVVICAICLLVTYVTAKVAGLDVGYAAGLWTGGQTISAAIGLATDAINSSESISNKQEVLNQIPLAYAVCYLWGTIGTGMILAYLGPKLIGTDLVKACKDYEAKMSQGAPDAGMDSAWHQLEMRAIQISQSSSLADKTVADLEASQPARIFVEAIRRGGDVIDFDQTTVVQENDIIAVSGPTDFLVSFEGHATEIADRDLLNIPVESVNLVVTKKAVNGKTLIDLAKQEFARGVYLTRISRGATSVDVPILAKTALHRGDILTITGTKQHTKRLEKEIGYVDRSADQTDMVWVGLFILLSGLVGAITINIASVPITLSVSGGVLIGGLILGWLRSIHPTFGLLPTPTQWFMNSVGLNVFIAIVGLTAGPTFISGLMNAGAGLFICGLIVTSVPMLLAPIIGKYIFKFDPAINLGCCGGSRTSTASVAMVADKAKSNIPMLGYTVPYAVSNTLLTLIGMIIVMIY